MDNKEFANKLFESVINEDAEARYREAKFKKKYSDMLKELNSEAKRTNMSEKEYKKRYDALNKKYKENLHGYGDDKDGTSAWGINNIKAIFNKDERKKEATFRSKPASDRVNADIETAKSIIKSYGYKIISCGDSSNDSDVTNITIDIRKPGKVYEPNYDYKVNLTFEHFHDEKNGFEKGLTYKRNAPTLKVYSGWNGDIPTDILTNPNLDKSFVRKMINLFSSNNINDTINNNTEKDDKINPSHKSTQHENVNIVETAIDIIYEDADILSLYNEEEQLLILKATNMILDEALKASEMPIDAIIDNALETARDTYYQCFNSQNDDDLEKINIIDFIPASRKEEAIKFIKRYPNTVPKQYLCGGI